MTGSYTADADQARAEIVDMIPHGATVFRCGSMTAVGMGLCSDCRTPQRICNMWSTIEGHMIKDRIYVKLIGENLGY
jgi:hypothetical protein